MASMSLLREEWNMNPSRDELYRVVGLQSSSEISILSLSEVRLFISCDSFRASGFTSWITVTAMKITGANMVVDLHR